MMSVQIFVPIKDGKQRPEILAEWAANSVPAMIKNWRGSYEVELISN
jgi:hypothetical protein